MPARSTIKKLPRTTRAQVDAFLAEKDRSVDEFVEFLTGDLGIGIGRTAAYRYQQDFEKVASKLRQSREITEAIGRELGDAATQGKQGRLLVEMTRSLVFDLLVRLQDAGDKAKLDPKDVANLGKGLAELGRALRLDQDFETKVREIVTKQAVEAADTVARKAGISDETRREIEENILKLVR